MKNAPKTHRTDPVTALNIRDFPDELRWRLREAATKERLSLREFVIASLRRAAEGSPAT